MVNVPKKAIVTGANGAIGSSIVRSLRQQGVSVFLVGSNSSEGNLTRLNNDISGAGFAAVDFTQLFLLESVVEAADSAMDGVDILVNCAGIAIDNLFLRVTDEEWDSQIRINLTSAWKMSKLCAKLMMRNGWGRIVSISSVIAHVGNPGQAAYAASKAGLIGMTRSLAREVGSRGVTVNTISPGFIKSPMTEKLTENPKMSEKILGNIPLGYFGEPEDVAASVSFLVSEGARYITGSDICVSGGMYMG